MGCGCGGKCCADNVKGKTGAPGASSYTYVAYAADAQGNGFSLIPNDNLEYVQFIVKDSAVTSLTIADFTGVWVKYIGDYGGNSDDFLFSSALTGDPGSGKLLFDNANLSAATSINVSYNDLGGFNVGNWLVAMSIPTSGIKAFVRVFKNDISKVFYAVTGFTNNTTYCTLTVQPLALTSNSPFTNADKVILSFCNTGDKGDPGNGGISAGTNHLFSDATTNSDPGNAYLKFDNANVTLATKLYINKNDAAIINVAAYIGLTNISNNANKAYIKIGLKSDESKFAFFLVTGLTDNGAWITLNLTAVTSSGTAPFPALGDPVSFIVSINGNDGASGNNVLFNDLVAVDSGNTSNVLTLVKNHDIPANTFQNNGDSVRIQILIQCMDNHAASNLEYAQVEIGGTNVAGIGNHLNYQQSFILNISIDRLTNNSYMLSCFWTPTLTTVAQDCLIVTGINFAAVIPIDVLVANTINVASTDAYMTVRKIFAEYKPV